MNVRERFRAVMDFQPVDRLPMTESYWWWDKTQNRWYDEGLPRHLKTHGEIAQYFGLDLHRIFWLAPQAQIKGVEEYDSLFRPAMDNHQLDRAEMEQYAREQQEGKAFLWCQLDGFFWFPRKIMGIERHLLAFYDEPELMHKMNRDILAFNLRTLERMGEFSRPDLFSIAEDMSYNHGPMLSQAMFDEFIAPYYRQLVPAMKKLGSTVVVDSDGDITDLIPWLDAVGVEGLTPLERMAGTDINRIRGEWPKWRMLGAFDKTTMHRGEAVMRKEFERILPVMKSGGYLPSCDHQTPPEVSLNDYRLYVKLLGEYCRAAAK
jgi:hypothetical protein